MPLRTSPPVRDRWLYTLLVLAAGAALRLWFIHAYPQIQGDSLVYGDIATNWLTHGIYGHSVGHPSGVTTIEPTLVRLPGYPAFLALCFALFGVANYQAVLYLQALENGPLKKEFEAGLNRAQRGSVRWRLSPAAKR